MNINYFLSSKKKLEKILSYLNEIKLTYYEIQIENSDDINDEYITEQVNGYEKKNK